MTNRHQMERQDLLERVRALRGSGRTVRSIASELGVHRSSVHRAVKALAKMGERQTPLTKRPVLDLAGSKFAPSPALGAFVGRDREMEQLSSALEQSMSGRPHLMMLVGEPGIGKTRITQEISNRAQSRGFMVLRGRCYESMGTPPYWPWVQAILSYARDCDPERMRSEMGIGASDIAEIVPELRAILPALELSAGLEPEQARMRLFDSIVTFLKSAGQSQPLILVLDNLHWADTSSLLLLEFMSQELGQAQILTIGTYRDTEVSREHPLYRTLGELTKGPHFQRIPLSGLMQNDVGSLIELISGTAPSLSLTEQVHKRTGGNPLFVIELVRLFAREKDVVGSIESGYATGADESWSGEIPEGVREVIGTRLYRMSEECNQALAVASVVGREFGLELLKRLMPEITEDRLLKDLDEALAAKVIEEIPYVVGRYQFGHALIQETLYSEIPSARRARLHADIAETLEELFGDDAADHASELAYHFAQAQSVTGSSKLVIYSFRAGEQALDSYAWEEALEHFQVGLSAKGVNSTGSDPAPDLVAAELLFGLGRAQVAIAQSSQSTDAVTSFTRAFEHFVSSNEVERAVDIAVYPLPLIAGRVTGVGLLIQRALDLVPADSLQAGRLQASYGRVMGIEEVHYEAARQAFNSALDIARQNGDFGLELQTLSFAGDVDGYHIKLQEALGKSLRAVELARRIDNPRAELMARMWCFFSLGTAGDLNGAAGHARAMLPLWERLRHPQYGSRGLYAAAAASYSAGDYDSALIFCHQGLTAAPRDPRLLKLVVNLENDLSKFDEGSAYLDRFIEVAKQSAPGPNVERAFASIAISESIHVTGIADHADTAEEFCRTIRTSLNSTPAVAAYASIDSSLLSVFRRDAVIAEEQYNFLAESPAAGFCGLSGFPAGRILGLLAHTAGWLEQAINHFEHSLTFCKRGGYIPALAWTCHDYADALLDSSPGTGRTGEEPRLKVYTLLAEALAISSELGMLPLTNKVVALQELAEAKFGPGPAYPDGLTVREVEVLRLVAAGLSNRGIAAELVLSTRTVERHITNIYGKIGARGRADATSYALGHDLIDDN